jgi:predicted Zn-dependent protease with MMP-like domain
MDNPWSNLPPTITLFRNNLERMAADREQIIEELRITLFHEIGHFLGLDEEDLAERGLD